MPTCSFCKKSYKFPQGLTLFTFDGRSVYFCSSKCRRNHNLGRDPKKVGWTKRMIGSSEALEMKESSEVIKETKKTDKKEK
jgi:large subunit ribosomal protein L24e